MKKKRVMSILLAATMVASLATTFTASASEDTDNGDGSYYNEELGYTYGSTFWSDEPVTYTMFFNDNDAYPIKDSWYEEGGIFDTITKMTNVTLDITVVNNASYSDKVTLAISGGTAPYIIPKMYSETAYVTGGGIVAVSDYVDYMPNYSGMIEDYDLQSEVDTLLQEDGSYYRLPGLKETALQDYSLLIRSDIFEAAGYDVTTLEDDWTWDEFTDILVDVKAYMVEQGMISESDYIWSDRWCGATSGYGQGGCLLNLIAATYGIHSGWSITSNSAGLYFDWDNDEFVLSATSDAYKEYMSVVQRLVSEGILDPETWSQEDDTADGKFYRGETAIISTNRSSYTSQVDGLTSQLGEGNFSVYEVVIPTGNNSYQAENSRLECGVCISSTALNELGEDEFIKMMRFVDWLWYSEAGLTMTKWGVEGDTYTVEDGVYSLTDGYYCGGLSIAQSSDDQIDMRLEYGYACGNFMYSGSLELLTSNFSTELQDYYNRMAEYRELSEIDPSIAMSEDDAEMANLWATPLQDTINTWTLKFAMGQADVEADWDTYVAEVEAQNAASLVNLYNDYYQASK
ncbi:MAG: extracellular solute-binding protein [Lachnospiraceae bacterium]|nr:extracellular solute-binding protein [Lachnospiraceae bacterium]